MKISFILILSIVGMMLIGGCTDDMVWVYPSGQQQAFYRNRAQCEAMSDGGGATQIQEPNTGGFIGGYNLGSAIRHDRESDQIYNDCMRGHGYYLEKKTQ